MDAFDTPPDSCVTCVKSVVTGCGLECHAAPPSLYFLGGDAKAEWPAVMSTDWCYQFEATQ